jgi:PPOX class probable F420-dependent enzyme
MSDAELRDFVRSHKTMTIVSNGPQGFPHPMPMWFVQDDDGVVRMTTFRKSQKVRNLRRDPRVALLVEDGVEYAQLRGVVLYGRCEVIDDLDAVTATLIDITGGAAANDPAAREGMAKVVQGTAAKRVLLRTRPDRIVSWDHRKLGGRY